MHANFGSRLNILSDEVCQINTKVGHIARWQLHLGGFAPSPEHDSYEESLASGNDDGDDVSGSEYEDEMIVSQ